MSFLAELYLGVARDAGREAAGAIPSSLSLLPTGSAPLGVLLLQQSPQQPPIPSSRAGPVLGSARQDIGNVPRLPVHQHSQPLEQDGDTLRQTHLPPMTSMVNLRASCTVSGWPCGSESGDRCLSAPGAAEPLTPTPGLLLGQPRASWGGAAPAPGQELAFASLMASLSLSRALWK